MKNNKNLSYLGKETKEQYYYYLKCLVAKCDRDPKFMKIMKDNRIWMICEHHFNSLPHEEKIVQYL